MSNRIRVAFVIPFAFERFFHDVTELNRNPDKFEDEIISKRDTWHFNWCLAMKDAGMEVTVYHISMFGKSPREYRHHTGIKIVSLPANFKTLKTKSEFSIDLLKHIKLDNPEIVFSVTHFLPPIFDMYDLLVFYCKLNKIPIVTRNAHADTYSHIFPLKRINKNGNLPRKILRYTYFPVKILKRYAKFRIKQLSLKMTSCTLTQTDLDYHNLEKKFRIPASQLKPFPKPVNLDLFYEMRKKDAAAVLAYNADYEYILHISNLFDTKGCEHIINILPDLLQERKNLYLLVIGNGPKLEFLRGLSLKNSVQGNVLFIGQVDHKDLIYYYNVSDVFVLPTEIDVEGQPNVIIESIACNTFPVSSSLPGPAAIIKQGLGKLIDPQNYTQLKKTIVSVLDSELAISQQERKTLLHEYSFQNVGNELRVLFSKLIRQN
jgi:glycosyltransferase involved in cell wall biosynthesis